MKIPRDSTGYGIVPWSVSRSCLNYCCSIVQVFTNLAPYRASVYQVYWCPVPVQNRPVKLGQIPWFLSIPKSRPNLSLGFVIPLGIAQLFLIQRDFFFFD